MRSNAPIICSAFGLLSAMVCFSPQAKVVVNEVMANEPGGSKTLEWIEAYNDSFTEVSMSGYRFRVTNLKADEKWIELPDSLQLNASEYYIICRRLFSTDSSGFEDVWGNSSGVWGDTPEESRLQIPLTAQFSLTNDSGAVELYDPQGALISELAWHKPGQDGFSWERTSPQSLAIDQSVDHSGSTPGFVNSLTPMPHDLALSNVEVASTNGETLITFKVANRGLTVVSNAQLFLYLDPGDSTADPSDAIDTIDLDEIDPGLMSLITRDYFFNGIYVNLMASLSYDDRNLNNTVNFIATGVDFPPIILSELLANPEDPLKTEWIEIKNRHNEPFDITGWRFGDSLRLYTIADTPLTIDPNEYFILTEDSQAFLDFYHGFNKGYLQPDHWPEFNDKSKDIARLVDSFGIEVDRFEYEKTFEDNYTWSRGEDIGRENDWGRSENMGGSPGKPNSVLYEPAGSDVAVMIEPNVFSPDGDGFEDIAVISVEAPKDKELTLRIYDRQGRVVKTLIDGETYLKNSYEWDGSSDANNRLPIGIYILYFEAADGGSVKKPIVIAR